MRSTGAAELRRGDGRAFRRSRPTPRRTAARFCLRTSDRRVPAVPRTGSSIASCSPPRSTTCYCPSSRWPRRGASASRAGMVCVWVGEPAPPPPPEGLRERLRSHLRIAEITTPRGTMRFRVATRSGRSFPLRSSDRRAGEGLARARRPGGRGVATAAAATAFPARDRAVTSLRARIVALGPHAAVDPVE